jgi:hypothetical protein
MSDRAIPVFLLVAGLCVLSLMQPVSLAREAEPRTDSDRFREELVEFLADLGRYSPTVLGELYDETQSLATIRERVDRLTPEELASLQEVFSLVPDWRMVPEALAASIPPEARQALGPAADQVTERVIELRDLRAELGNVYALARLLPPETLERLDLDQASVAAAQGNLHHLTPQRLSWLDQRLGAAAGWQAFRTTVPSSLPPEIRRGSLALARQGELEAAQVEELAELRQELDTFLADAERLPPEIRQRLDLTGVGRLRDQLAASTPEMLFVLREEIDSAKVRGAMRQVRMLAGLGSIDATERAELQAFRGALESMLAVPSESAKAAENVGVLRSWLSARTDAELALVRQRIERVPDWRHTTRAVLESATSPGVTWMVERLRQGSFDSGVLEDLLSFREQLFNRFNELQNSGTMDAERAGAALRGLEKTDVIRLAVMRNAYFRQVHGRATPVSDGMLVDLQAAVELLAPEVLVASGFLVPTNCSIPSVGSIGGQCLGIPGCDFCPEVCFPELTLPGLDLGPVCAAFAPLESAIDAADVAIDAVGDVINGIFTTVTDLATTVAGLADPVVQAIIDTLELIVEASGLSDYLDPDNLAGLLGIVEGFWDNIPNLPTLPCPPDGTNLPLFGEVGQSETAFSYSTYKWIFEKLLELIPNSEESVGPSIAAQVLYAGVEYLGICLETAADMRDDAETGDFRATVEADLVSIIDSLVSLGSDAGALESSVDAYGAATSGALAGLDSDVDGARNTAAQIAVQLTDLQNVLVDDVAGVEEDAVRSRIEANLVRTGDDRISTFQLPDAFGGLLEIVRQIVLDTIQDALDAGFDVTEAQAEFDRADAAVSTSDYKTAYERFRTAYRRATRGIEPPLLEEYVGDLDGNGQDDLIVDFGPGPGLGLYIYFNSTSWVRLHGLSPEALAVGDLDGNGKDELIADFGSGPGLGLYVYFNASSWTRLHGLSPVGVFVGDLDGNGQSELIVDFGASVGLYAYYNNSGWVRLFGVRSALITRGELDTASITSSLQDAVQEALQNTERETAPPADPYPEDGGRSVPPEPRPEEPRLSSPPEPVPTAATRRALPIH